MDVVQLQGAALARHVARVQAAVHVAHTRVLLPLQSGDRAHAGAGHGARHAATRDTSVLRSLGGQY